MAPLPSPTAVGPPGGPGPVTSPLVVRTDPAPLRRRLVLVLGVDGVAGVLVLLAVAWFASFGGFWVSLPLVVMVMVFVFQMVWFAYAFGRRLGADPVAQVGPDGITLNALRHGWVALPWAAVGSVGGGALQLVIKPVPGTSDRTPGASGPTAERFWRRAERRGLRIGAVGITPDLATVRAAIAHFSGGRHL